MHELKIKQIKKAYLRNYTLSFDKDLTLIVKTPIYYTSEHVKEIVVKHKDWIEKNLSILKSKKIESEKNIKKLIEGEVFEILEEEYILKFKEVNKKRYLAYLEENYLIIEIPEGKKNEKNNISEIKEALINLFKKIATTYIYSKATEVIQFYRTEFNTISIKDQSTKWGSCSTKRNLNFNWRLIFTPYKVIDYVVIHEICHLKEMNHSKNFWKLVELKTKDYKQHRKWLRDNQDILKNLI